MDTAHGKNKDSEDEERSLTSTRQKAMEVIQSMNQTLQSFLPNQIGRYDAHSDIISIAGHATWRLTSLEH